jgi:TonB family protein
MKTSPNIDLLHSLSQDPRMGGMIFLSIGLHMIVISAMFFLPNLASTRTFYSPIYSVRLVNVPPNFGPVEGEVLQRSSEVLPSGSKSSLSPAKKEDPEKKITEVIERLRSKKEASQLSSAIERLRNQKETRQVNSAIERLRNQKETRQVNSAIERLRSKKEASQLSSAIEATRREKEASQVSLAIESLRKETRQLSSTIEATRREKEPSQVSSSIEGLRKEARQLSSAIEATRREEEASQVNSSIEGLRKEAHQLSSTIEGTRREKQASQVGSAIEGLRKEARQVSSAIEGTRREKEPSQVSSSIEGLRKEAHQLSSAIEGLRRLVIIGSSGAVEMGEEGTGGASSAVMSIKFKIYYNLLWQRIRSVWVLQEEALGGKKNLETIIAIRIAKDGQIEDIQFEKKSGNPYLDESALRAIKKANPLPPLPSGIETDKFDVGVRFTPSDL